ncbi:MAG: HEAT repeat domain-containing protein [Planctomycetes bacterium]|nr:HEAT repeat domain-containing protein [Planctomycetota bacterium]
MSKQFFLLTILVLLIGCSSSSTPSLSSADPDLRRQALIKLSSELKSQKQTPVFLELLKHDDNSLVRAQAASYLGKYKIKEAVPNLIQACKDKNHWVRYESVLALGQIGDTEAVATLIELSEDDPVVAVRRGTVQSLKQIKDPKVVPALITRLEDTDPSVSRAAWLTLKEVTGQSLPNQVTLWEDWLQKKR